VDESAELRSVVAPAHLTRGVDRSPDHHSLTSPARCHTADDAGDLIRSRETMGTTGHGQRARAGLAPDDVTTTPETTSPTTTAAARSRLVGAARHAARAARRAPLTAAVVVVLWAIAVVSGSLPAGPAPDLLAAVGAGIGPAASGHWWFPLTSALWCSSLATYLGSTALLVALLQVAERRLGALRAGGLALLVQVVGSATGVAVAALIATTGGRWADQLAASTAVGASPAAFGAALPASAALPALWRRRLRVLGLVWLVMMALYSGLLADVLRLVTGLVGLAAGMVLLRGRRPARIGAPSRAEARVLVALVVAASAVGPLVAAIAQTRVGPLSVLRFVFASPPPDPVAVGQICLDPTAAHRCGELRARLRLSGIGPGLLSVVPVLLLLTAAEGLRRGRRAAWLAAIGLNTALTALGVVLAVLTAATPAAQRVVLGAGQHLHAWLALVLPALQPLAVVGLLLAARGLFRVRADPGAHRRWVLRIAAVLVAVSAVYVIGGLLVADQFDRAPGLLELLADLPVRFLPPGYLGEVGSGLTPVSRTAALLFGWTGVVFWAVVLVAALDTFARTAPPAGQADLDRVRRLLARTGGSSLAHLATWPGQSYWFLRSGSDGPGAPDLAAVAYRVVGGVAVSTGEPVGDPLHAERAVRGFVEHAQRQGWTPCLYSVGTAVAEVAVAMGWQVVQVAEETVLRVPELAFTGRRWQDVRTALNAAARSGITAEWTTYRSAPLAVTDQIRAISEEWVADKGMPEMGFTLGGLDELADDEVRLLLAVDGERTVHGVTSWLPVRRDGEQVGWTLDFMRRRSDGFRGVMEFLIASAALRAKDEGLEFLSLSGAPLARLDRGEPVRGVQRVLDLAGRALEPVYGFGSLLAFKAKFQPEYRPLHLAYPDPAALGSIATAIGRAYLPGLTARQAARLTRRLLG